MVKAEVGRHLLQAILKNRDAYERHAIGYVRTLTRRKLR